MALRTEDLGIVERNRHRLDLEMARDNQLARIEKKQDEILELLKLIRKEQNSPDIVPTPGGVVIIPRVMRS